MNLFFSFFSKACRTILSDVLTFHKKWDTNVHLGDHYYTEMYLISPTSYVEIWVNEVNFQMAYEIWYGNDGEALTTKVEIITNNVELFDFMDRFVNDLHDAIAIISNLTE